MGSQSTARDPLILIVKAGERDHRAGGVGTMGLFLGEDFGTNMDWSIVCGNKYCSTLWSMGCKIWSLCLQIL